MFKFENPQYFYALVALPLMVLLFVLYLVSVRKKMKRLGDSHLVAFLTPYVSRRKRWIRAVFLLLAFTSLVIAMCNLQTGTKLAEVKREAADIIVCLDVSNSMLAQDLQPNRLVRAKFALERMFDMLQGDRVGLVLFAGEAYVQLPITSDYSAAKIFLDGAGPDMVPVQGTNMSAAISKAIESFGEGNNERNRAIVLITDGEDHEQAAVEMATEAEKKGIMICTIGIGSESGVPIPLVTNGVVKGYRKDNNGNLIVTKLNSSLLKEIAAKGNGVYVQASQADLGLDNVLQKINSLEKNQIEEKMYEDYEDQFQWFVALTLLFLLVEFIMSERVSEWYRKLDLYGNK